MKKLLIILLLFISCQIFATNYYVKSSGSDAANGLTIATAWQTITKVNTFWNAGSFAPGDNIYFNRGDTFYGTITVKESGASGNLITVSSYGTGAKPIITGFTTISGWTDETGGIYSKVISSAAATQMVTIDGVQYGMGRFPDTGWNSYESCVTNTTITDNTLGGTPDWTGAEVVIRKNDWTIGRANITDHVSNTLTYTDTQATDYATAGYGYFIQNDLRTLTSYGEWYHDTGTGKFYMYFGAVDPTTKIVRVATLNNLLVNSSGYDYITLSGLTFTGSIGDGLSIGSGADYNVIQNCNISFSGTNNISIGGSYATIDNNSISYANNEAITITAGNYQTITNNDIENISLIYGSDKSSWPSHIGIMFADPSTTNTLIQYNILKYIGASGIGMFNGLTNVTVKNNYIDNAMYRLNDGAGIYNYGVSNGITIQDNIVSNVTGNITGATGSGLQGHGIYLDNLSDNITISGNTCFGCSWSGIFINKAHDNLIEYNTCYNNTSDQLLFSNMAGTRILYNNPVNSNIFFSKESTEHVMRMMSVAHNIDDPEWKGDYNYYTRPIDDNTTMYMSSLLTIAQFKTLMTGQETHSAKSTATVDNVNKLHFIYNSTKVSQDYILSQAMVDAANTSYSGTITLLPWESLILIGTGTVTLSTSVVTLIRDSAGKLIRTPNGKILMITQ